jgi:hypothetical protein
VPAHGGASRRLAHEAAGDLRERRLARAVRAEQPDDLTAFDRDIDARERLLCPVALRDIARFEGERRAGIWVG